MPDRMIAAYPLDHPRAHHTIVAELFTDTDGTIRATASRRTLDELNAQDGPGLRVITLDDWRAEAATAQASPVHWEPCSEQEANEMLEVLPPIAWDGCSFCVGEPTDHCFATGRPRYTAYRQHATSAFRSSRPVTVTELQENRARAPRQTWTRDIATRRKE